MYSYYLLYNNYFEDERTHTGHFGHYLLFNPWDEDVEANVTIYYQDKEPESFSLPAYAGVTNESNFRSWGVIKPGRRFASRIQSKIPLICQHTGGWNNLMNNHAPLKEVRPDPRETVISYTAITRLSNDWYHPDCIVIDMPDKVWLRESEWIILLNPGVEKARANIEMIFSKDQKNVYEAEIAPMTFKFIQMDDITKKNVHYGVHVRSDKLIAAQWYRTINWYTKDELMAHWSVPMVPAPLD